jgi:H+/Cl- antiporter ClcA
MTTGRTAERLGFRPAEGDERLQVLLVLLLLLCVFAGWLLIRELAPAARHGGPAPAVIEAAAPGN